MAGECSGRHVSARVRHDRDTRREVPRAQPLAGVMKRLVTLGRLVLTDAGSPLLGERRKDVALLAFLAGQSRPTSRGRLASLLWPQADEPRARQSLRRAISDLRSVFGDALAVTVDDVALAPGAISVDADDFEREIAAGDLRNAVARW